METKKLLFTIILICILMIAACNPAVTPTIAPTIDTEKYNLVAYKDLISEYLYRMNYMVYENKVTDEYELTDLEPSFAAYGAHLYECKWNGNFGNGRKTISSTFLIKYPSIYPVVSPRGKYEIDFDNDGETELIYHTSWGSGIAHDNYYVIEKAEDEIYFARYQGYPVIPAEEQSKTAFLIRVFERSAAEKLTGKIGKLAYVENHGIKIISIAPYNDTPLKERALNTYLITAHE